MIGCSGAQGQGRFGKSREDKSDKLGSAQELAEIVNWKYDEV